MAVKPFVIIFLVSLLVSPLLTAGVLDREVSYASHGEKKDGKQWRVVKKYSGGAGHHGGSPNKPPVR